MSKNNKKLSVKVLTTAAMLAAISAVIGIICKNAFTYNGYYRFTLENAPIILAGLIFGPVVGGAVGVCADAVSCIMSSNPAINPIISLGAASVGVISGVVPYIIRKNRKLQTAVAVLAAHLIGQVGIKSIAKIVYYSMPYYGIAIGLALSVVMGAIEYLVIRWIRSQKGLEKFVAGDK